LVDRPVLFQPGGKHRSKPAVDLRAEDAGDLVWLRVEHQGLQRLADSGAILFTIRIHRTALARVAENAAATRALLSSIRTMDPQMQIYKSLPMIRDATEAYLRRYGAR